MQYNQNDALERFNLRIVSASVVQSKGEVCATEVCRKAYSHQRTDDVTLVSTVFAQLGTDNLRPKISPMAHLGGRVSKCATPIDIYNENGFRHKSKVSFYSTFCSRKVAVSMFMSSVHHHHCARWWKMVMLINYTHQHQINLFQSTPIGLHQDTFGTPG